MPGLLGKIETEPVLATAELVNRLGSPTRVVDGVRHYEPAGCSGAVIAAQESGNRSLPYWIRIIADSRLAYEKALGTLLR